MHVEQCTREGWGQLVHVVEKTARTALTPLAITH